MLANLLQDVRYALHGFASCSVPFGEARRASRVDPVVALRAE